MLYFAFERHDGRVVEVIPVVVRDGEHVDVGHVRRRVDVAARERLVYEENGRGVWREYGVDEDAPAVEAQKE